MKKVSNKSGFSVKVQKQEIIKKSLLLYMFYSHGTTEEWFLPYKFVQVGAVNKDFTV